MPETTEQLAHAAAVAANFPVGSIEHDTALYHDHVEDDLGPVPDHVRAHVEVLTRRDDETYHEYVERVATSGDAVAIRVKDADAHHNYERSCGLHGGKQSASRRLRYWTVIVRLRAVKPALSLIGRPA